MLKHNFNYLLMLEDSAVFIPNLTINFLNIFSILLTLLWLFQLTYLFCGKKNLKKGYSPLFM